MRWLVLPLGFLLGCVPIPAMVHENCIGMSHRRHRADEYQIADVPASEEQVRQLLAAEPTSRGPARTSHTLSVVGYAMMALSSVAVVAGGVAGHEGHRGPEGAGLGGGIGLLVGGAVVLNLAPNEEARAINAYDEVATASGQCPTR